MIATGQTECPEEDRKDTKGKTVRVVRKPEELVNHPLAVKAKLLLIEVIALVSRAAALCPSESTFHFEPLWLPRPAGGWERPWPLSLSLSPSLPLSPSPSPSLPLSLPLSLSLAQRTAPERLLLHEARERGGHDGDAVLDPLPRARHGAWAPRARAPRAGQGVAWSGTEWHGVAGVSVGGGSSRKR